MGMTNEEMLELARSISTGSDDQEIDFNLDAGQESDDSESPESPSRESDVPADVETDNPTPSTSKGQGKGKGKGKRTQLEKVYLIETRC